MIQLAFFRFFPFMPGPLGWIIMVFMLLPYFLPTIIAMIRNHRSAGGIFALNFFLGWTLIGWIASLVWALSESRTTVIVNNTGTTYIPDTGTAYTTETQRPVHQTNPTLRPNRSNTGTANSQEKIDQLRQLKQLLDEGVLTNEEFNRQKAAILG